jgi:hypothetical protein
LLQRVGLQPDDDTTHHIARLEILFRAVFMLVATVDMEMTIQLIGIGISCCALRINAD